jgi:beta-phosphoglucomutase-like phosphatase (HAD superfamily)
MRKNIDLILEKTGLNGLFDVIVSGDMVTRGKPHPDIFLKAAEALSVDPKHCIVLEDSTNGLKAASAAGMYAVAYRNPGTGPQDLSLADLIIDRFDDPALYHLLMQASS